MFTLPETNPRGLDQPQEEDLDGLPTPLDNQEDTVMLEVEDHMGSAVDIPVVDHNCTAHPVLIKRENYSRFSAFRQ